jgi:cell division protease FtsH
VHVRKVPLGAGRRSRPSSRAARRASPAPDLANLVQRGCLVCRAWQQAPSSTMEEFDRAKDKIMMGAERKSHGHERTEEADTAYHEAGHAIVASRGSRTRPGAQGHRHSARPCARA